jgi:hypothetical protein
VGSVRTNISNEALAGCEEAGRLHLDYTSAVAAFERARDRLLAGWNNARQRTALESGHARVMCARQHYWSHIEDHGCCPEAQIQ